MATTTKFIHFTNVGEHTKSLIMEVIIYHSNDNGMYISLPFNMLLGWASGPTIATQFYFLKKNGDVGYIKDSWKTDIDNIASITTALERGEELGVLNYSFSPRWKNVEDDLFRK